MHAKYRHGAQLDVNKSKKSKIPGLFSGHRFETPLGTRAPLVLLLPDASIFVALPNNLSSSNLGTFFNRRRMWMVKETAGRCNLFLEIHFNWSNNEKPKVCRLSCVCECECGVWCVCMYVVCVRACVCVWCVCDPELPTFFTVPSPVAMSFFPCPLDSLLPPPFSVPAFSRFFLFLLALARLLSDPPLRLKLSHFLTFDSVFFSTQDYALGGGGGDRR